MSESIWIMRVNMSMAKFYNYQDERGEELLAPTYKVAAYCRLSKEDDDIRGGESVSISHQKEMIEEFCARKGWEIKEYYIDDGFSGTKSDRPALQRMLKDIIDKKI